MYCGSGVITDLLNALNGTLIIDCLTTIGTILPAMGIAMNFKAILSSSGNRVYLYFLLGFMLYEYFGLPLVAVGVIAVIIALIENSNSDQPLLGKE